MLVSTSRLKLINHERMNLLDAIDTLAITIDDVTVHAASGLCVESMLNRHLTATEHVVHAQRLLIDYKAWRAAGETLGKQLHNCVTGLRTLHESIDGNCPWCIDHEAALTEAHYALLHWKEQQ